MATRVVLKSNKVPEVRNALQDEVGHALDDFGDDLKNKLQANVWKRLGFISHSVTVEELGEWQIQVVVGWVGGEGFYSGFQEFGTVKQAARPVVRPIAHEGEPVFAQYVTEAIRKAASA
jgi:HK97 gp10 family phage protein